MFNQVLPTCVCAKKPQNTLCTKGLFAQRKNIPSGGSLETLDTQLAITSWESLVSKTSWHRRKPSRTELAVHLCFGAGKPSLPQPAARGAGGAVGALVLRPPQVRHTPSLLQHRCARSCLDSASRAKVSSSPRSSVGSQVGGKPLGRTELSKMLRATQRL